MPLFWYEKQASIEGRTRMISRLAMVGLAAAALSAAPAFATGKPQNVSWGRPGVSFETYQADALECANQAYGVDVQMRPFGPAASAWNGTFLPAAVWTSLTPGQIPVYTSTYVEAYRHAAWMDVVDELQMVVDHCLTQKGYQQFRLTSAQMDTLRRYRQGTSERARYLHGLGADAHVLAAQAL